MALSPETLDARTLGEQGEPCPTCGAPLAADQRYCLVVHVSAGGSGPVINSAKAQADKQRLENLQNLSGSDYSKQSRKLPKTLELPGKAPPKDNKQGGGGSGFQTIG